MNNIIKIVKPLKESGLLIKGVSETTENEAKEQKRRFPSILSGTLEASLLGNLLTGRGTLEQVKLQLGQVKIFNATSSLN